MWRRYEFEMQMTVRGVVEVFVPDDDDACMEGSDTPEARDAIRAESAREDLRVNLPEVFKEAAAEGGFTPTIVSFVPTTKRATVGRL